MQPAMGIKIASGCGREASTSLISSMIPATVRFNLIPREQIQRAIFNLRYPILELGLLVWQDFCGFACGVYPAHESFVKLVSAEAEANVAKLAHHPCILIWCGNNEDYQQINQWKGRPWFS